MFHFRQQPFLAGSSVLLSLILLAGQAAWLSAQEPAFTSIRRQTNQEIVLQLSAPAGGHFRLDASTNLASWTPLLTWRATAANSHTDAAAPYFPARAYRVVEDTATNVLTGDHLPTDDGEVIIRPVNHASFVLRWRDVMIYNDPVGGSSPYQGLARADLILVSHSHSDHFESGTLNAVRKTNSVIVAPAAVWGSMSAALRALTIPLANGGVTNVLGVGVEAVPAYNGNHPRGTGNGYVLTIGGRRLYLAGDTGSTPEMRALPDIDVAFLCMNVPYTMSVADAVTATRAFRPRVVYPYHYRNQDNSLADLNRFKRDVGTDLGIEVRLRKWY